MVTAAKAELPKMLVEGPVVPRMLAQLHPLELPRRTVDVLVIGGGVAGLSAAIAASETRDTLVLLKGARGDTATSWAQGGMAAVLGDDDSADLHVTDTLAVASGLGDAALQVAARLGVALPPVLQALLEG